MLVFFGGGYRTLTARYVAKWSIAKICLCETKCQGGDRTILGSANLLKKYRAIWGIAAIVSQYRPIAAIWGH